MIKIPALVLLATIASLHGCASYNPVPKDYSGPICVVADSGWSEDFGKAQIFALIEVDGHPIKESFQQSRQASFNQGPLLRLVLIERPVPAQPMKVKIRGSHATGMPIHEFASRALGTFFEIEGVVDFRPNPNGKYRVAGSLSKDGAAVWIEDMTTYLPATEKVSEPKRSE